MRSNNRKKTLSSTCITNQIIFFFYLNFFLTPSSFSNKTLLPPKIQVNRFLLSRWCSRWWSEELKSKSRWYYIYIELKKNYSFKNFFFVFGGEINSGSFNEVAKFLLCVCWTGNSLPLPWLPVFVFFHPNFP